MKHMSQSEWVTLIEDTAHDRVAWNSHADCSPWDSFYRDYYRDAPVLSRQEVDEAFLACLESSDPSVIENAILHAHCLPQPLAVARLMQLLVERSAFLLAHSSCACDRNLLAQAMNTLASCAASPSIDPELRLQVRNSLLHWLPRAGPLGSCRVGTFFSGMGPEAVDALAKTLATGGDGASLLVDAGYELHRTPDDWRLAMDLAERWPKVLRDALQLGGAKHAE